MIFKTKRKWIQERMKDPTTVLDVGFVGQGIDWRSDKSLHGFLRSNYPEVYGIDLDIPEELIQGAPGTYQNASAEDFAFDTTFDAIVAGDLIEHLSNPGLFLGCVKRSLRPDGRLYITTPNAFNLFNLFEKLSKAEPTVNADHTCYFNSKTLRTLLKKNGFEIVHLDHVLTLENEYAESWKKRMLNILYRLAARFTPKFVETIAIEARVL